MKSSDYRKLTEGMNIRVSGQQSGKTLALGKKLIEQAIRELDVIEKHPDYLLIANLNSARNLLKEAIKCV